jgi:chromosomal replication initiation ATPase DnaA
MSDSVSYWAYPGMAVQGSMLQHSGTAELPSPVRVIDECIKEFGITEEDFYGERRFKKIVQARRFAGHILFHFCGWSFVKLAVVVGKDRTNMMHHVRVLEQELKDYKEERDAMFAILERLELLDLSSSSNDWYFAWVHNQLKDVATYNKVIHNSAAEALAEIVAVTHADGRVDKSRANKIVREGRDLFQRVETIATYAKRKKKIENFNSNKTLQDYASTAKTQKFEVKKINPYSSY